jgi:hypothetical protein
MYRRRERSKSQDAVVLRAPGWACWPWAHPRVHFQFGQETFGREDVIHIAEAWARDEVRFTDYGLYRHETFPWTFERVHDLFDGHHQIIYPNLLNAEEETSQRNEWHATALYDGQLAQLEPYRRYVHGLPAALAHSGLLSVVCRIVQSYMV